MRARIFRARTASFIAKNKEPGLICTPKVGQLLEVHIFMSKKKRFNTKYSPEFKLSVIMDMRETV